MNKRQEKVFNQMRQQSVMNLKDYKNLKMKIIYKIIKKYQKLRFKKRKMK